MAVRIHPSAYVDPKAQLGDGVDIGPQAFVDADVVIGEGTHLMHGAHIARWTTLGKNNRIFPGAIIGQEPQDLGYKGEESYTLIGDGNVFREGVTVHRGNRPGTRTLVGDNNYFMVNSHIAHNCILGNHIILVNGALLAGHVEIDDRVIISGNCQVHQFVRIGAFAMMRGGSGAAKDVPPFCINDGLNWIRAINVVGLKRNGFTPERVRAIKEAFKIIFRSGVGLKVALEKVEQEVPMTEDVQAMLAFIRASARGIGNGRGSSRE
ncbi:acyl-[acyl-carrier-protein]--UDP-N-acetylglucosamine O-acyltransferase [Geoalkalibacter ferrihydriticus]|uniref:UDP-N-acetylglucosamine acyltransferase n=2 Tax=Geoalkalibacter ferrihydriticus TaxID=392333 RepID=A0A0C2HJU6_9BACT|nr:acyl-ACP--UDP-N-acetylglucosamine O-acyltransferase [Geoalkalibacter ferrihydriticus]KIH77341.1 UDP-N-acetylglucosamine acyltransferase [Geoalkalibacter ferrihydriticus DSM 17813]SDM19070.1 acyl-[acyl-carrier-protein]--UDP-N-acetylglucosamine O-acyltransferase [Geoalkalibacter ferrihydriticus]